MPSSVFGGKNSNENTGQRSVRIWSIRIGLKYVQPGRDPPPACKRVGHVDRVVLPVGARDRERHREPAPEAELALLLEIALEDEQVAAQLVVLALGLRDAVEIDLVRRLGPA